MKVHSSKELCNALRENKCDIELDGDFSDLTCDMFKTVYTSGQGMGWLPRGVDNPLVISRNTKLPCDPKSDLPTLWLVTKERTLNDIDMPSARVASINELSLCGCNFWSVLAPKVDSLTSTLNYVGTDTFEGHGGSVGWLNASRAGLYAGRYRLGTCGDVIIKQHDIVLALSHKFMGSIDTVISGFKLRDADHKGTDVLTNGVYYAGPAGHFNRMIYAFAAKEGVTIQVGCSVCDRDEVVKRIKGRYYDEPDVRDHYLRSVDYVYNQALIRVQAEMGV